MTAGFLRGGARSSPRPPVRLVIVVALATLGVASVVGVGIVWLSTGPYPIDTATYVETAARLNDGLPLYGAHERPAGQAQVTLFSPPLMAVMLRPLALLPQDIAMPIWVALMAAAEIASLVVLLRRSPLPTGVLMTAVAPSIVLTMIVGNVDALVLLALVASWLLLERGHETTAGLVSGIVASLKLTPFAIAWWMLVTGRRRAFAVAMAVCAVLAVVAVLGSEPLVFLRFAEVTLTNFAGSTGLISLATIGQGVGIPAGVAARLPTIALLGGLVAVALLRRRPRAAWVIAVVTMVFGSPVTAFHTPALLLATIVPFAARHMERSRCAGPRSPQADVESRLQRGADTQAAGAVWAPRTPERADA